jgi:WD40 repeat protein
MFRKCYFCPADAIKVCSSCSNKYLCEKHIFEHIMEPGSHLIEEAFNYLNQQEIEIRKRFLLSRIRTVQQYKKDVLLHAVYLHSQIDQLCMNTLNNLYELRLTFERHLEKISHGIQIVELEEMMRPEYDFDSELEKINELNNYETKYLSSEPKNSLTEFLKSHTGEINCLACQVTNDNQMIYSAGNDKCIRQWNYSNQTIQAVLEGHTMAVNSIALSKNNTHLASGSADRTVRI